MSQRLGEEYKMRQNRLYIKRRKLAVSLFLAVLSGTLSGCALPDDFAGMIRPVEEVVSTVRQNIRKRK